MGRFPDFLIIGAAKSGTSFLHELLLGHPDVVFKRNPDVPPANDKEIHFFDARAYDRLGIDWYKGRFPFGEGVVTGEATPYYMFCPRVPERVHRVMPAVKLIAVLRNPVARAFSDYHHRRRDGLEPLSFEDVIRAESERIRGSVKR